MWLTQNKRDQVKAKAALKELPATLGQIVARLRERQPAAESYRDLLRAGVELTQSAPQLATLHLFDPQTGALAQTITLSGGATSKHTQPVGLSGRAARTRQPQVAPRVSKDPDYVASTPEHRAQSALAVPVLAGDACLGVLGFESERPDWFTEADVTAIQVLADAIAALAVSDEQRQSADATATMLDANTAASALKRQLTDLLDKEVLPLFSRGDNVMAEFFGVVPESRQLISLALRPDTSVGLHIRYREGEGTIGQVYKTGRMFVGPIDRAGGDSTHLVSTHSSLIVPISARAGEIVGVLNVESPDRAALTPAVLARIEGSGVLEKAARILDALAAQDITNDMVIEQLLNDAETQIFSIIDPEDINGAYHQILQIAAQIVEERDVAAAILLLRDEAQKLISSRTGQDDRGWLVVTSTLGDYKTELTEWPLVTPSVTRRAIERRTWQLVDSVSSDPDYMASGDRFKGGSELCVPLFDGDTIIGAIDLVSPTPNSFTATDAENLQRLASYVIYAIKRANDIADEQSADQKLHYVIDVQDIVTALIEKATLSESEIEEGLRQALSLILRRANHHAEADYSAVLLKSASAPATLSRRAYEGDLRPTEPDPWPIDDPLMVRALTDPKPPVEADITELPAYSAIFAGTHSVMAVPLRRGNEQLGVLLFESSQEHHFSNDSVQWAKFFAIQVVAAMTGIALVSKIQRERTMDDLSDLIDDEISVMIQADLDTVYNMRLKLLQRVLDKTREETGASRGAVYLSVDAYHLDSTKDPDNGRLVRVISSPAPPTPPAAGAKPFDFSITKGVSGQVFMSDDEKMVVFNSVADRPASYFRRDPTEAEALSGMVLPLFEGVYIVGILLLESEFPGCFSDENVAMGKAAGRIASDIIVSAKMRQEEIQADLLREFEIEILRTQQPDLARYMAQVLQKAREVTDMDDGWGQITLVRHYRDPATGNAVMRVDQTFAARFPADHSAPIEFAETVKASARPENHPYVDYVPFVYVIDKRESWLSIDVTEDPDEVRGLPWPDARSLVVAPLVRPTGDDETRGQDDAIGFIALAAPAANIFDDSDDEVLRLFTQTIVIGLRNIALLNARKELMHAVMHVLGNAFVPLVPRIDALNREMSMLASRLTEMVDAAEIQDQLATVKDLTYLLRDMMYWLRDMYDDDVKLDTVATPSNLAQLVDDMRGSIDMLSDVLNGQPLRWELPPAALFVEGGTARDQLLKAALFNYIENALKYGLPGTTVHVIVSGTPDGKARIAVRSTGPQLDPSEYELIFDLYYRGSNVSATSVGSGIGLFQVRDIATRLKGKAYYAPYGTDQNDFVIDLPRVPGPTVRREEAQP